MQHFDSLRPALSHIMNVWLASFWIQEACLGCQGDAQHLLIQMPCWSPKLFFWAKAIIWDFPNFCFFLEESFNGFSASASGTDILPMCSSGPLGICLHHGPFLCVFFFCYSNKQHESLRGPVRKVSRICWSPCSVLAQLEGQQTFHSWV